MDSQHPRLPHQRPPHPHLHNILPLPLPPQHVPDRTANSTPVSSPGLFSPTLARPTMSFPLSQPGSETATPGGSVSSPYLHPLQGHLQTHLQGHKVRETHKANVEHDYATGRKLINNYEIIEELGRGVHGKVKLARNAENGEFVAIKIIPRFSKKRRLGKVTAMSTQDKSKREIAILKKIRHPNVVALLEVIDDPELKKIYMVLEHVELGEVVWRKKGLPHICEYERRRVEREMRGGIKPTPEEERFERLLLQRQATKDAERARIRAKAQRPATDYWSLEYGPADDEELDCRVGSLGRDDTGLSAMRPTFSNSSSLAGSRATSRAPSRTHSTKSLSMKPAEAPFSDATLTSAAKDGDLDTPGALPIEASTRSITSALEGTMYGAYLEDPNTRGRSPSMADSLASHLSAFDFNRVHDPYVDDFSYVPCFTLEQAKNTFRDTVLGLEYLHYEGVVHRDIKPANLLWTKDKRAKIADFGVSYFGRPVRDGEPDDTISESEAKDFDNDLELAKTVGTPAFFAPELCATDLYDAPPGKQPKVTEQIDVWSLGVTLYCLVFARLPFLAEDEWQMFKKIANEEVYIPTRRLRPVDPATKPSEKSLYTRVNNEPYRDDDELAYEDIDTDLQELLRKMLTKNPDKRIRLRDVKRHAWVMKDLHDKLAWIDDTDPSRRTSGRRIQVDEKDITRAVVPLNIFERARSVVKKAVGKVMHPRGERTDSVSSRRRATSSAASSAGDSPITGLITPHLRDSRRRSLRPDEYFSPAQQTAGHPLTQSVLASPQEGPQKTDTLASSPPRQPSFSRRPLEWLTTATARDEHWSGQSPVSPQRALPRHGHARSLTNTFLSLTPAPLQTQTLPPTPLFDSPLNDPSDALRKARDTKPTSDELGRARSVDRGLFASDDKRAEARVSLSTAVAPGNVHFMPQLPPRFPTRSMQLVMGHEHVPSSTVPTTPSGLSGYQNGPFKSDPNMHNKQRAIVELEERPMTAHRAETSVKAVMSLQHVLQKPSTPEPADPALVPCPPSPDEDGCPRMPLSRGETIATGKSSSTTSVGVLATPLTSPSESASPIYATCCGNNHNHNHSIVAGNDVNNSNEITKEVAGRMLAFQSDPSLPALLSSTSSVSADLEGEFLGNPGVVGAVAGVGVGTGDGRPSVIDTTDSLTPPAFAKEPGAGEFPLEGCEVALAEGAVAVKLDKEHNAGGGGGGAPTDAFARPAPAKPVAATPHHHHNHHLHHRRGSRSHVDDEDDDDDSDSDEGLTMAKRKKPTTAAAPAPEPAVTAECHAANAFPAPTTHSVGRLVGHARRRNTNVSVGSTETAKKVVVGDDE